VTKRRGRLGLNVTLGCNECLGGTLGCKQGFDQDQSRTLIVVLHGERERCCCGSNVGLTIPEQRPCRAGKMLMIIVVLSEIAADQIGQRLAVDLDWTIRPTDGRDRTKRPQAIDNRWVAGR
jgi:hypothetical protein